MKSQPPSREPVFFVEPPATNLEAEQNVVGSVLIKPELFSQLSDLLRSDDFVDPLCRDLFRTFAEIREAGKPIDQTVMREYLSNDSLPVDAVAHLINEVGSTYNVI